MRAQSGLQSNNLMIPLQLKLRVDAINRFRVIDLLIVIHLLFSTLHLVSWWFLVNINLIPMVRTMNEATK
jgi:hypothetical protein